MRWSIRHVVVLIGVWVLVACGSGSGNDPAAFIRNEGWQIDADASREITAELVLAAQGEDAEAPVDMTQQIEEFLRPWADCTVEIDAEQIIVRRGDEVVQRMSYSVEAVEIIEPDALLTVTVTAEDGSTRSDRFISDGPAVHWRIGGGEQTIILYTPWRPEY